MTSGCATPHATLDFIAPSTATAGTPFTVTVNVVYQGKPDTVINSHIHFTSSDPDAVLPGDYYFTPADAGSHTWTNGFTLSTPGNQTISGAIFDAAGINGTATVAVVPLGNMLSLRSLALTPQASSKIVWCTAEETRVGYGVADGATATASSCGIARSSTTNGLLPLETRLGPDRSSASIIAEVPESALSISKIHGCRADLSGE